MIHIATLITCYNRFNKTYSCIKDIYNQKKNNNEINIDIYIVDGGSTDGTPTLIKREFPLVKINVCPGVYWAGGMRKAWEEAYKKRDYDFFWLINDDTHLYNNCLNECIKAHKYSIQKYNQGGIYIGSTQDPTTLKLTYGGIDNKGKWIVPDGENYIECNLGNANIMMVHHSVYQKIGGFAQEYTHGIADYDYTLRAVKKNIPVFILPIYGGSCENDHKATWLPQSTSLKQRIQYLYSPKGLAYKEYMIYLKKFYPHKVLVTKCKLWIKTLFPIIWQKFKTVDPE